LELFGAGGAIWVTNEIWNTSFLFICFFVYYFAAVGKPWLSWSVAIRRAKGQVILLI